LQLATKVVQVLIDQSYSPIKGQYAQRAHPQIIGPEALWTDYWTDFESEVGFEKVLQMATKLVQVVIDQRYSFTPQGPMANKAPHPLTL
jgi:hypothetical protein